MKQKIYIIFDNKSKRYWTRNHCFGTFPPDVIQYLNEEGANKQKDFLKEMFPDTELEIKDIIINV